MLISKQYSIILHLKISKDPFNSVDDGLRTSGDKISPRWWVYTLAAAAIRNDVLTYGQLRPNDPEVFKGSRVCTFDFSPAMKAALTEKARDEDSSRGWFSGNAEASKRCDKRATNRSDPVQRLSEARVVRSQGLTVSCLRENPDFSSWGQAFWAQWSVKMKHTYITIMQHNKYVYKNV